MCKITNDTFSVFIKENTFYIDNNELLTFDLSKLDKNIVLKIYTITTKKHNILEYDVKVTGYILYLTQ